MLEVLESPPSLRFMVEALRLRPPPTTGNPLPIDWPTRLLMLAVVGGKFEENEVDPFQSCSVSEVKKLLPVSGSGIDEREERLKVDPESDGLENELGTDV